ncbi:MAG: hypothetical protein IRZ08_17795 [Frankia sp.]|nr:hypothetical protein [Frankia sp.]
MAESVARRRAWTDPDATHPDVPMADPSDEAMNSEAMTSVAPLSSS